MYRPLGGSGRVTKQMSYTVGFKLKKRKQSDLEEVRWSVLEVFGHPNNATYTPLKIDTKIFSTKVYGATYTPANTVTMMGKREGLRSMII